MSAAAPIYDEEGLAAVRADWESGRVICHRGSYSGSCRVSIIEHDSGRYDVIRYFNINGKWMASVDVCGRSEREAWLRVVDLLT